jgi:hypothetical protein
VLVSTSADDAATTMALLAVKGLFTLVLHRFIHSYTPYTFYLQDRDIMKKKNDREC